MNDQFLHDFRRQPDQEFSKELFRRIEKMPQVTAVSPKQSMHTFHLWIRVAIFCLVLMTVLSFMPPIRARLQTTIQQIGQMTLEISDEYPTPDNPEIVPSLILPLDQARQAVSFQFGLPTELPDGLIFDEDAVRVLQISEGVQLSFIDPNDERRGMWLNASPADPDINYVVGPDSITETTVNDQPAVFIYGGWDSDTQTWRDYGLPPMLRWEADNVQYMLIVSQSFTAEDLLDVAESVSPITE